MPDGLAFVPGRLRVGIALIPNNASTAIWQALNTKRQVPRRVSHAEFAALDTRAVLIRDPFKRMESVYRERRGQRWADGTPWPSGGDSGLSAFVITACAVPRGGHFKPQYDICAPEGAFLPNYVIGWDLDEVERLLRVELPPANPGLDLSPLYWTPPAMECFRRVYARDIELWDQHKESPAVIEQSAKRLRDRGWTVIPP